jgi:hypothetical protein
LRYVNQKVYPIKDISQRNQGVDVNFKPKISKSTEVSPIKIKKNNNTMEFGHNYASEIKPKEETRN